MLKRSSRTPETKRTKSAAKLAFNNRNNHTLHRGKSQKVKSCGPPRSSRLISVSSRSRPMNANSSRRITTAGRRSRGSRSTRRLNTRSPSVKSTYNRTHVNSHTGNHVSSNFSNHASSNTSKHVSNTRNPAFNNNPSSSNHPASSHAISNSLSNSTASLLSSNELNSATCTKPLSPQLLTTSSASECNQGAIQVPPRACPRSSCTSLQAAAPKFH
jgi:hypothetical protein